MLILDRVLRALLVRLWRHHSGWRRALWNLLVTDYTKPEPRAFQHVSDSLTTRYKWLCYFNLLRSLFFHRAKQVYCLRLIRSRLNSCATMI